MRRQDKDSKAPLKGLWKGCACTGCAWLCLYTGTTIPHTECARRLAVSPSVTGAALALWQSLGCPSGRSPQTASCYKGWLSGECRPPVWCTSITLHAADDVCRRTGNFAFGTANLPDLNRMPLTTFADARATSHGAQPTSQTSIACRGQRLPAHGQLRMARSQLSRHQSHAADNVCRRTGNFPWCAANLNRVPRTTFFAGAQATSHGAQSTSQT